ncbi:hypothetical protein Tco_0812528 [Tanacetum coccineum]
MFHSNFDPFVEIPSGESKVHIEVLSVLLGNRLPSLVEAEIRPLHLDARCCSRLKGGGNNNNNVNPRMINVCCILSVRTPDVAAFKKVEEISEVQRIENKAKMVQDQRVQYKVQARYEVQMTEGSVPGINPEGSRRMRGTLSLVDPAGMAEQDIPPPTITAMKIPIIRKESKEDPSHHPTRETSAPPAPKTAKQLAAKRNQERVKSILLLAIPDEYLLKYQPEVPKSSFSWNQIALNHEISQTLKENDIEIPYNNLRVYEDEMKMSSSSTPTSQNLAFLSFENTSNTNEVSTIASRDFGLELQLEELSQVPTTPCAHKVLTLLCTPTTRPHLIMMIMQQIDEMT